MLGLDPDDVIQYDLSPHEAEGLRQRVLEGINKWKSTKVASRAGLNHSVVVRMRKGQKKDAGTLFKLEQAIFDLAAEELQQNDSVEFIENLVQKFGAPSVSIILETSLPLLLGSMRAYQGAHDDNGDPANATDFGVRLAA